MNKSVQLSKKLRNFFPLYIQIQKTYKQIQKQIEILDDFLLLPVSSFFGGVGVSSNALEFMVSALMNFNLEVSSMRSRAFLLDSITLKTLYCMDLWSQHCNFNMCSFYFMQLNIFSLGFSFQRLSWSSLRNCLTNSPKGSFFFF